MINTNKVIQNIIGKSSKKLQQDKEVLNKTIEIDCAPISSRPDVYMKQICAKTGLKYKEPIIGAA